MQAHAQHCPHRKPYGFTAIELLVVIAIIAVLTALALPSFTGAIERYRVNAIKDELIAAIQLARLESIRRSTQVSLIRTTGCGITLASNDDWNCGYEVFVDTDGDGVKDTGELVLQTFSLPSQYTLAQPNRGAALRMNIWGLPQSVGIRFVVTPPSGVGSSAITALCISAGGRVRTVAGSSTCS